MSNKVVNTHLKLNVLVNSREGFLSVLLYLLCTDQDLAVFKLKCDESGGVIC